jgi:hypothetical protein
MVEVLGPNEIYGASLGGQVRLNRLKVSYRYMAEA